MGYQQSIVKAKASKVDEMLKFSINNAEWFVERDFSPYSAVECIKSFELGGTVYKEGEICLIVGGERHPQRSTTSDGLASLDFIEDWFFIENITELDFSAQIGALLDKHFKTIEDDDFYKQYESGEKNE